MSDLLLDRLDASSGIPELYLFCSKVVIAIGTEMPPKVISTFALRSLLQNILLSHHTYIFMYNSARGALP